MIEPLPELKFIRNPQRFKAAPNCPCGKDNRNNKFVPFEGFQDKGFCHSCGKTFYPELNKTESQIETPYWHTKRKGNTPKRGAPDKPVTTIPFEYFEQSVNPPNIGITRANSSLFQGLLRNKKANIPETVIIEAMNRFYVGYSGFKFSFSETPRYISNNGTNIFWLIDEQNRIRGGQVVLFDSESPTCSTLKVPFRHTRPVYNAIERSIKNSSLPVPDWLKEYKEQQGNKMPCLFGLPQLQKEPNNKPIAICEAAKTALVGWIYFPEYLWLAIGSKSMLKVPRLKPLVGRSITLFPDLSNEGQTFTLWNETAKEMELALGGQWNTSRVLEDAPDLTDHERTGGDLADYLLTRWDWNEFQLAKGNNKKEPVDFGKAKTALSIKKESFEEFKRTQPEWFLPNERSKESEQENIYDPMVEEGNSPKLSFSEIEMLESFFATTPLPAGNFKLNPTAIIVDLPLFVRSHLATIKGNKNRRSFKPYMDRLNHLKTLLIDQNTLPKGK